MTRIDEDRNQYGEDFWVTEVNEEDRTYKFICYPRDSEGGMYNCCKGCGHCPTCVDWEMFNDKEMAGGGEDSI